MNTSTDWPSSLDDAELEELDRYLRAHCGDGDLLLDGVHGMLSAIAVGPVPVTPTEWLPEVLHERIIERIAERHARALSKLNSR